MRILQSIMGRADGFANNGRMKGGFGVNRELNWGRRSNERQMTRGVYTLGPGKG